MYPMYPTSSTRATLDIAYPVSRFLLYIDWSYIRMNCNVFAGNESMPTKTQWRMICSCVLCIILVIWSGMVCSKQQNKCECTWSSNPIKAVGCIERLYKLRINWNYHLESHVVGVLKECLPDWLIFVTISFCAPFAYNVKLLTSGIETVAIENRSSIGIENGIWNENFSYVSKL